jgi:sirohydrochlorin ferrochelatase
MEHQAVLVIAHGSPHPAWMEMVEEAVREAKLPLPVRVAYLGGVEERSIPQQLAALGRAGADRVIAVPLFVSSGSGHIEDIRRMLDLNGQRTRIAWCEPLNGAPEVVRIAADRVAELSIAPERESLLLVGHGSGAAGLRGEWEQWERMLKGIASRLRREYRFKQAAYATLLPDTVAAEASRLASAGRVLVVPLFLSVGYFTRTAIPQRLEGVPCEYNGKTYLPHPLIAGWIRRTVTQQMEVENFAITSG